ncbi:MAG: TrmJ/YjtD family RNA methyltransferase [Deltaproteobacteria bacterium]|nr:MAG: TrmJ/YjtD family RNA methyltransferase [Deltaproteobacteria bacterium]
MNTNEVEPEVLAGLRVVLCRTSHAGNIGGAARAMKVMGLSDLALVSPREFPHPEATTRATGAADLLDRAHVVGTLDEAVADCVWVVGFTARDRVEGAPVVNVEDAAAEALAWAQRGRVAFVFGNERTGLENTELVTCNALARIPTSASLSSLNLAAAVQVASYELRRQALQRPGVRAQDEAEDETVLASRQDLTALFDRVWNEVSASPRYRADDQRVALLRARFEQLMVRAQPRRAEIRAAHGVLSWLAGVRED